MTIMGNIIKRIGIICCASIMSSTLFMPGLQAQTHYKANISIGAKAGANFSRVEFTPSVDQSFIPGMNAGLAIRYIEENHFGFIWEVNFEQRGWQESFDEGDFEYKRTVNYLQIPFLAHIYFGRRGKFFINAGPSVSFTLSDKISSNFDYKNVGSVQGFPLRTTYQLAMPIHQKVDYGITGGIGGEFSINRRNSIYLDARFYYGLGNMLKSGRTHDLRGSNSMTISVSAGYWFRVK